MTFNFEDHVDKLLSEWHPVKNLPLKFADVKLGSGKKVWWLGPCGHEYLTSPNSRTNMRSGCPYCSGKRVLEGFNDLATTRPDIAAEFICIQGTEHTPNTVTKGSKKIATWRGATCGHVYTSRIDRRSAGGSCSVCVGSQVEEGVNDLATRSPGIAKEWHPSRNGNLKPTQVTQSSRLKAWWLGSCGHEYVSRIDSRHSGNGCNQCVSRTSQGEEQVLMAVSAMVGSDVEANSRIVRSKTTGRLIEMDIYVPALKVGIEFNGTYWHSEKAGKTPEYHVNKRRSVNAEGIRLISIWQYEWESDPSKVINMLEIELAGGGTQYSAKVLLVDLDTASVESLHAQGYQEVIELPPSFKELPHGNRAWNSGHALYVKEER